MYKALKPSLDAMGSLVSHMGPVGTGTATKLCNQLLTAVHAVAASEALQLTKALGITNIPAVLKLIGGAYGNSRIFQR